MTIESIIGGSGEQTYLPTYVSEGGGVSPQDQGRKLRLGMRAEMGEQLDKFASMLITHLEYLRMRCEAGRQKRLYTQRMEVNERRARNHAYLVQTTSGRVSKTQGDGQAELGILQGSSAEAIRAMSSHLYRTIFQSTEKPYVFKGTGEKEENSIIPGALEAVTDYFFRVSEVTTHAQHWEMNCPKHGTAVVRSEMAKPICIEKGESGYERHIQELQPCIRVYHLDDVLVTNAATGGVEEQEAIFYVRRDVTYFDLLPDEAVVTMDQEAGLIKESGKFFDIDLLLADGEINMGELPTYSREPYRPPSQSSFTQKNLIEVEAALPLVFWAESGDFTPEIAQFFMIPLPDTPEPDKTETEAHDAWKAQFVKAVALIPSYRVSYVVDQWATNNSAIAATGGTLHQFEVTPTTYIQKTLSRFPYVELGNDFYGQSITDIGRSLEDKSDYLLNQVVMGAALMANPPVVHDKSGLDKDSDLEKLFQPAGRVESKVDPNVIIKQLLREFNTGQVMQVVDALNTTFEAVTGASATLKGTDNPSGETLGQTQIKDSRATGIADDIAIRHVKELHRMIWSWLFGYAEIEGFEAFQALLARCSGLAVEVIAEHLPDMKSLRTEWLIEHPMSLGQDKAVMAQQLGVANQIFPGQIDPRKGCSKYVQLIGIRSPSEVMVDSPEPIPIDQQHDQMMLGNYVTPGKMDDHVTEIMEHMMELQKVMGGEAVDSAGNPIPPEAVQPFVKMLNDHINQHRMFWQMMNVEMAQSMQMAGPGGSATSLPAGESQMSGELSSEANAAPSPVPSGDSYGAA